MTEDQGRSDQGGEATSTTGGGASTDRGGRDAGTPGPDPGEAASGPGTGGSKRFDDSNDVHTPGTGAPDAPSHGAGEATS